MLNMKTCLRPLKINVKGKRLNVRNDMDDNYYNIMVINTS